MKPFYPCGRIREGGMEIRLKEGRESVSAIAEGEGANLWYDVCKAPCSPTPSINGFLPTAHLRMPSSPHACGPPLLQATPDFHLPGSPTTPPPLHRSHHECLLTCKSVCGTPPGLPSVPESSPDSLACVFVSPSPSGPADLLLSPRAPCVLWALAELRPLQEDSPPPAC